MPEVANAGEDHREAEPVSGVDDVLILYRATGLNGGGEAVAGRRFESIGEREERIGGDDITFEGRHGFGSAELHRIDAAHLARARTDQLTGACIDDCVRLDVFANLPAWRLAHASR